MHARLWCLLVICLSTGVGCADQTALLIEVTSDDLIVPVDLDELTFEVTSRSGQSYENRFAVGGAWPHSLTVLPALGEQHPMVTISVTAYKDGAFRVRRVLEATFEPGVTRTVRVALSMVCLDVVCPSGIDCRAGECQGAPTPMPDAGVLDAGVLDAGIFDSGVPDSGVPDSGVPDSGVPDSGVPDSGVPDSGVPDSGVPDSGVPDSGVPDSGIMVDFAVEPTTLMLDVSSSAMLTIRLSAVSPAGGLNFTATDDFGATYPSGSGVSIPAGIDSGSLMFTAPASPTAGTLTLTQTESGASRSTSVVVNEVIVPTGLVINEIDYDNPGTDDEEFIEIYNPTASAQPLASLQLIFINGSTGAIYDTQVLSAVAANLAPGGYLVLADPAVMVAAGALSSATFMGSSSDIQNGAPDAVVLYDTSRRAVVDALSYEGSVTAATVDGMTVNLVEGTPAVDSDSTSRDGSLIRMPNGRDTDDAATDWQFTTCPTPGSANVSVVSGGC